jgi:glycerol-3-phosphate dehydrogenase
MPHGALWWEDALLLDPSAFVRHLRARIESQGAEIHEGCPVELVKKAGDRWNILVKDAGSLSARVVVDARSESGAGDLREERSSSGASEATAAGAMNLEFDFLWEPEVAIGIRTSRRRLFFAVPRDGHTVVGTWYYPHVPSKDRQGAEEARFVEEIREAFGDARFIQGRIIHRDFGLLPMRCRKGDEPELWGRHACAEQDGFVTIRSTKYTTFRLVGEEALTKAARALRKGMS